MACIPQVMRNRHCKTVLLFLFLASSIILILLNEDSTISFDCLYFKTAKIKSPAEDFRNFNAFRLQVDKNKKLSSDLLNESLERVRNLPITPVILGGQPIPLYNYTCAPFPTIANIKFDNIYWQKLETEFGSLYFYGAYYDNRNPHNISEAMLGPTIRILGMMDWDVRSKNFTFFCQLWFENEKKPVFSRVTEQNYIWMRGWGRGQLQPFLFTCLINETQRHKVPSSVSVVVNPCDFATNNLRVHYESTSRKNDFAVCVKGLDFSHEDISVRLVEWIELTRLLGADKIFFYEFSVHPNVSKVLKYYKRTGFVDVTSITLPGGLPNDPSLRHIFLSSRNTDKRQNELIPYNDCLYRNLYNYEYLTLLDTDEIIIPSNVNTWNELMTAFASTSAEFQKVTSIVFQNVYFFEKWMKDKPIFQGIPWYMYHLQNVYRAQKYYSDAAKYFFRPESVVLVHNHYPVECLGECKPLKVEPNLAHVQHYKTECPKNLENCSWMYGENPVLDTKIWRYKDALIYRTLNVLKSLGFISI